MTYPATITKAIYEVMQAVGYVQKKGENTFHKYRYAGEKDLLEALRPAMLEAGLLLIPSGVEHRPVDQYGNTQVGVAYTLAHKDGDVWPDKLVMYGCGNDRSSKGTVGDKGTYKALTGANKYLLFKLFQIETGDDPEKHTAEKDQAEQHRSEPVFGELTKTKLQAKLREFDGDLRRVSDMDELNALLVTYDDTLNQAEMDLPSWWWGVENSDTPGIKARIDAKVLEFNKRAQRHPGLEAEAAPAGEAAKGV